jgi:hypothetical protein
MQALVQFSRPPVLKDGVEEAQQRASDAGFQTGKPISQDHPEWFGLRKHNRCVDHYDISASIDPQLCLR